MHSVSEYLQGEACFICLIMICKAKDGQYLTCLNRLNQGRDHALRILEHFMWKILKKSTLISCQRLLEACIFFYIVTFSCVSSTVHEHHITQTREEKVKNTVNIIQAEIRFSPSKSLFFGGAPPALCRRLQLHLI